MRIFDVPIAHRGVHDPHTIPENSLAAFQKAIDLGYNIELDVRLTKDGQVVVFHDGDLNRVVGHDIHVNALTLQELQAPPYLLANGEPIPTFADVLQLVDGKVDILCELKSRATSKFLLEKAVYALCKGKEDWVIMQSFNPYSVKWFKKNAPEFRRGLLATKASNGLFRFAYKLANPYRIIRRLDPMFLAYHVDYLPSKRVTQAVNDFHLKFICWTVRTNYLLERALDSKVDNIIFEHIDPSDFHKRKETK